MKLRKSEFPGLFWLVVVLVIIIKSIFLLFSLYSNLLIAIFFSFINVAPIIFFISFSFLFSKKYQLIYLLVFNYFISFLFFVDLVYAKAFGHLISIYMIFAKNVTQDLSTSIISLIKWTDFLMFVDLPYMFVLIFKKREENKTIFKQRFACFSFAFILSAAMIYFQFTNLEKNKDLGNIRLQALSMSPLGNHMFDLYRFIYEKGDQLNKQEITTINNWLMLNVKYQDPDKKYAYLRGFIKGKNIIIVQVESLESIVIGKSYFGQEITPNINKLLVNSIYFNNIHEQVRDGNSSDAELMFNTSIYPLSNGSAFLRFGGNTYNSLPKLLDNVGYTSAAIHGDDREFWNRNRAFPALGFNKYIAEDQFNDKSSGGMGILDKSLFAQSYSEIERLNQPYYLFIITLTSHMPFNAAKDVGELDLPNDDVTSRYLKTINYTDKVFGEFYKKLKEKGLLDNSVLIIYGDHEGIHKYYHTALPNNNLKIPFIIYVPGMNGLVIDKIGGQIDMMPTLVYLLGIEKEKYATKVMGRNLFCKAPGAVLLSDGKIIGQVRDKNHLRKAQDITDIIIRGNYFNVKQR